jgi:hypothetical protein
MKDLFFDLIGFEPESGADWILIGIISLVVLFLAFLVIMGLLYLVDTSFLPCKTGYATAVSKTYRPQYTEQTIQYNPALEMALPHTIEHGDRWTLYLKMNGETADIEVTPDFYNKVVLGQDYKISYSVGRLSKDLMIKNIY